MTPNSERGTGKRVLHRRQLRRNIKKLEVFITITKNTAYKIFIYLTWPKTCSLNYKGKPNNTIGFFHIAFLGAP